MCIRDSYQWMRIVVLADKLESALGLSGAVVAAYADGDRFHTAKKVRLGHLGHAPASAGRALVIPLSYQSIVACAKTASEHPSDWIALGDWIGKKISSVGAPEYNNGSAGSLTNFGVGFLKTQGSTGQAA